MRTSSKYIEVVSSRFEIDSMRRGWCENNNSVCETHWITELHVEVSGFNNSRKHPIYIYQSLCQKYENKSGHINFILKVSV